jgi:hypothetical protein
LLQSAPLAELYVEIAAAPTTADDDGRGTS